MAKVKVWNRGREDYEEVFRGKNIVIPKGKFVEMDKGDAQIFLATQSKYLGKNTWVEKNLDTEEIEKPKADEANKSYVCNYCSMSFSSALALNDHLAVHVNK
jgi:hypothetical protein